MDETSRSGATDRTPKPASTAARTVGVAVAGGVLLLFGTPLNLLWIGAPGGWWLVYSIWIVAIALILVASRRGG